MSSVRQRHPPPSPLPSSPPPITSPSDLSTALSQAQRDALANGLSEEEFAECLSTAAQQKLNINLRTSAQKPNKVFTCCCLCLKTLWLCVLVCAALILLVAFCKPVSFYVQKKVHTKLYDIARVIRLGALALLPYITPLGFDPLRECVIANPLLNGTEQCACFHVTKVTEVELNGPVLPDCVLKPPQHNVYVIRKALHFDHPITLDMFQDFHRTHGGNPNVCTEIGHENQDGLAFYQQLFDRRQVEQAMASPDPWSFLWEECPTPSHPLTFRSLLPPTTPLPSYISTSTNTLFTLSTQWAMATSHQGLLQPPLVVVFVLQGEVRVTIEPTKEHCFKYCDGLTHSPVNILTTGDMFILDQRIWLYQTHTWSNISILLALGLDTT